MNYWSLYSERGGEEAAPFNCRDLIIAPRAIIIVRNKSWDYCFDIRCNGSFKSRWFHMQANHAALRRMRCVSIKANSRLITLNDEPKVTRAKQSEGKPVFSPVPSHHKIFLILSTSLQSHVAYSLADWGDGLLTTFKLGSSTPFVIRSLSSTEVWTTRSTGQAWNGGGSSRLWVDRIPSELGPAAYGNGRSDLSDTLRRSTYQDGRNA